MKKANVDPAFRQTLLAKRSGAAGEIGLLLDPAEARCSTRSRRNTWTRSSRARRSSRPRFRFSLAKWRRRCSPTLGAMYMDGLRHEGPRRNITRNPAGGDRTGGPAGDRTDHPALELQRHFAMSGPWNGPAWRNEPRRSWPWQIQAANVHAPRGGDMQAADMTIVGGRLLGSAQAKPGGGGAGAIPRGIEVLVKKASAILGSGSAAGQAFRRGGGDWVAAGPGRGADA